MTIVTRFAPSPSGPLHLGHAWSALQAYALAAAGDGRFLLRIEDLDAQRSQPIWEDAIAADLAWLGIGWERPVMRQSARLGVYADAVAKLAASGLIYRCFCTRSDIAHDVAASLTAPHGASHTRYPGTCRAIDPAAAAVRALTAPHAWRIDMAAAAATVGTLRWSDDLAGSIIADPAAHGDIVIARKGLPASYHLAVVIDDAAQAVTHVVRGVDLFAATDIHRLLQALLDLPVPRYRHHPLIGDATGRRLAKRDGAVSLSAMRAAGVDGIALAGRLVAGVLPAGFSVLEPERGAAALRRR